MNGSCGNRKRGCEIDYALPHDRIIKPFSTEMLRDRNDIQAVLPASGVCPYQIMEENRPLEKVGAEANGALCLL